MRVAQLGRGAVAVSGVLLLLVLVGVPVLSWIGAHLVVGLCLMRGMRGGRRRGVVALSRQMTALF